MHGYTFRNDDSVKHDLYKLQQIKTKMIISCLYHFYVLIFCEKMSFSLENNTTMHCNIF